MKVCPCQDCLRPITSHREGQCLGEVKKVSRVKSLHTSETSRKTPSATARAVKGHMCLLGGDISY